MSHCFSVKVKCAVAPARMPCPVNGRRSKQVDTLTIKSLVRKLPFGIPDTQYYFCDSSDCELVYFGFDAEAPRFRREDLTVRVGVKEIDDPVPVCYCFGVTRKSILEEIQNTGKSTAAERIRAEVAAGRCACEVRNPSGKCCLGDITRIMKKGASCGGPGYGRG